ncbi:endo-chitosanase [Cordyceps militaris CM01]|uniref:Endo-chitosanase n=2 Tax=Cordyceps militaris TaxID=73501 RepID=G3JUH4_CORMM|nr:endo-chitosanase [Cordyceps militaris CM01]ATY58674.1 endo-chitosanase [Cordyceps militaris]EGX87948.1 endo-chitosanase [Cordyceps militaris CM01]
MRSSTVLTLATVGSIASGYQLPAKLKSLYDQHKSGSCSKKLAGPFSGGASYCGDIANVIFLKGNGAYDNMDIDCDGANRTGGACANDPSGQGETAFKDTVKTYGIPDLDANVHPYVVFGNDGSSPSFNAQAHGIKPLSVMAVVCNGQVHYGIWGDTNGGTSTGEASLAMGNLCFPNEHLTGNNGHDGKDVLYIAFTGADTVPGKNGANWKAKNSDDFAKSIKSLGDKLVGRL